MENKTGVPLETHPFLFIITYFSPKLLEEKFIGLSGFKRIRLPSVFIGIGAPNELDKARDFASGSGLKSV